MATIQSRLSRVDTPRYTVLELEDGDTYGLSQELEARGITARTVSSTRIVLMSEQYGQAFDLLETTGYSPTVADEGLTVSEIDRLLEGEARFFTRATD